MPSLSARRAWIEIGAKADSPTKWTASLSARRAWIEIVKIMSVSSGLNVALRKESVDRNTNSACQVCVFCRSLSARRAWIEIRFLASWSAVLTVALRKESVDRNSDGVVSGSGDYVALRKESVDRNHEADISASREASRSPQGERG